MSETDYVAIATPEAENELKEHPSAHGVWMNVNGVLFCETNATNLKQLQSFYDTMEKVRQYIRAYEEGKKKKADSSIVSGETLLKNSNFFKVIQKQLAANPLQKTFVFHPLADPAQDHAFVSALHQSSYGCQFYIGTRLRVVSGSTSTTDAYVDAAEVAFILYL